MKYAYALLVSASFLLVGCGSHSPLSPDAVSGLSPGLAASTRPAPGVTAQAYFPPINPPGISCPSDAPQIRVSSLGRRMDIEFSEITGAYTYEIAIDFYKGNVSELIEHLEVPAPAHRTEWYGPWGGRYQVKVRTMNCGGFGQWSDVYSLHLDDEITTPAPTPTPIPEPEPEPEPEPQCMVACS
ncbi:MAG TPA: hypothetical protein VI485_05935 [Vicinamibacterales bacterium]|nr:hypothetical protein [Vicinamibacterales bacterium]